MTDREQIELAAKALGIEISWERRRGKMVARQQSDGYCGIFDPLNDSYDNICLQAGCRISVDQAWRTKVLATWYGNGKLITMSAQCVADDADSRAIAIRRAVVKVAVEIAKAMQ